MVWFKFYTIWGTGLEELSDAEAGRFIKAVCSYAESGETASLTGAERVLFTMALKQLKQDAEHNAKVSSSRAEAGRAGGLSKPEANASNSKQMQAKASNCLDDEAKASNCSIKNKNKELRIKSINTSTNVDVYARAKKPEKHKYGKFQNVLLTDDEYSKLKERFIDADDKIENLSIGIASKGYKYKDHYATILNWARMDAEKAKTAPKKPAGVNEYQDIYTMLQAEGAV